MDTEEKRDLVFSTKNIVWKIWWIKKLIRRLFQKNNVGVIGLKYSGDAFEFRKCTLENLDSICEIQEIAFKNLQNEDILRRNSREMLAACLDEPHYTLGVFYENVLVAFAILFDGGKSAENIGWDIGVSEQDINSVINFKLVIVLPEFRGNKLQKRLISKLE